MRRISICLISLSCIIFSCDFNRDNHLPQKVEGFVPVYTNNIAALKQIRAEPAREITRGGKIYTVGNLLFQVEIDSGIHVINYADPANPVKLGFIKSFLCKEVSVKSGFIYTNNFSDLVVIDIRNWGNIKEVSRIPKVFPDLESQYPERINGPGLTYFECPDPKKGAIIAWKKQTISKPKCWR